MPVTDYPDLHSTCCYCQSFLSGNNKHSWDQVLYESDNFVVVPSLGSIVPGWLLLVPKVHVIRYANIDDEYSSEINDLKKDVTFDLENSFGPVTEFEHGPSEQGSLLGCGIDHAHLHLVSLGFSMSEAITKFSPIDYKWNAIKKDSLIHSLKQIDQGYLYYSEPNGSTRYSIVKSPVSQYFRLIIAKAVDQASMYDYKKCSFESNIEITINALSKGNSLKLPERISHTNLAVSAYA